MPDGQFYGAIIWYHLMAPFYGMFVPGIRFPMCHFCRFSFVTESISPANFEIMGPNILGHDLDLSRSRDVISYVTNWFAIYHFLLASHWNWTLWRFRDIRPSNHVRSRTNTQTLTHTHTRSKWFCSLSMQCIALDRLKPCFYLAFYIIRFYHLLYAIEWHCIA